MWLIEIYEGPFNGITLPINDDLVISGSGNRADDSVLALPEALPGNVTLSFSLEDDNVYLSAPKNKEDLCLKENELYTFHGFSFFVYREGNRKPYFRRHKLKRNRWVILLSCILSVAAVSVTGYFWYTYTLEKSGQYLDGIPKGYLKDGKLYVYDQAIADAAPLHLADKVKVVKPDDRYLILNHLVVEPLSKDTGKRLPISIVSGPDRDKIYIQTFEDDNLIMQALGSRGIQFSTDGANFLVGNYNLAIAALKSANLENAVNRIQQGEIENYYLTNAEFPYSIFYSQKTGGYIFDSSTRYWVGSRVPNLGVIKSISSNKVVITDGLMDKIYLTDTQE